jgi:signal transduction protein with GAF and PtsI domain
VLIARNLGPAELLEYDRRRLKAVLLEEGSLTAHMTIVARAMGVPVSAASTTSATASRKARRSSSTATTAASSSAQPAAARPASSTAWR